MAKNLGDLFIDVENNTITEEANGLLFTNSNAVVSSDITKSGDGSIYFDGNSVITITDSETSETWHLLDNDFTMDCWAYINNVPEQANIMGQWYSNNSGDNKRCFVFRVNSGNVFELTMLTTSGGTVCKLTSDTSIQNNTWTHLAATRVGDTISLYINGVLTAQTITTSSVASSANVPLTIGGLTAIPRAFTGYVEKLRIINGEALWSSNFDVNSNSDLFLNTPIPASSIYSVGHRGNLRGKAKNGFVRPTIKEFFTSTNYEGISLPYLFIGSSENKSMMSSSSNYDATYEAQEAFNGIINGSTDCWICKEDNKPDGTDRCWIAITFDTDTKVHSFRMARRADGTGTNFPKDLNVYMDDTLVGSFTNSDVARGDYAEWHELSNNYGTTLKIAITSKYDDYPVYKWVSIAELQFYLM